MTAVEWLFENLCSEKLSWIKDGNGKIFFDKTTSNIFQQAKEMEKQQIIETCADWWNEGASYMYDGKRNYLSFEQYYNEKFKK